ncbi:MAG: ATP-binding protein [Methylococcaceae bacterium]
MTNKQENNSDEIGWRFVNGTVDRIQPGLLHLNVEVEGHPSIEQARLEFSSKHKEDYSSNQIIALFLTSPIHDHPNIWRAADGAMADKLQNPWQQSLFSEGDILEGKVVSYVENNAAIISLNYNLTRNLDWRPYKQFSAYLHRNQTPDAAMCPNIRDLLHVGDTVQAMLAGHPAIDYKLLHITLDVNQLLTLRKEQAYNETPNFLETEYKNKIIKSAPSSPTHTEKKLLIIDNDKDFCKSWQSLLKAWNIRTRYCQSPDEVTKELDESIFDGCLLDHDLGIDTSDYKRIEELLDDAIHIQQTGMKLNKMTGDHSWAQAQRMPVIEKPLSPLTILTWLETGKLPASGQKKRLFFKGQVSRWQAVGSETQVIKSAEKLLTLCCKNITGVHGLWIKLDRPGYYVVRVAHGIREDEYRKLELDLQNTVIATAIDAQREQERGINGCGPLKSFMEKWEYKWVWVHPCISDNKVEHVLAFFSPDRLGQHAQDFIRAQQSHFEDIAHWLNDAQQLETTEVFATQGRLLGSTLHEIRTAASTVAGFNEILMSKIQNPALNPDAADIREGFINISTAVNHLLELSENGLDYIRPAHTQINDIASLIKRTLHLMQGRIKSQGFCASLNELQNEIREPLTLAFPPKYVEIPLINLLDNALHCCGQRDWARIQVSLTMNPLFPETPIEIRVNDNGSGMTQAQVKKLFNARETGRGITGSGMGLYLAKQLIESVGGKIYLEKSVRWFGTNFCIRLPYSA